MCVVYMCGVCGSCVLYVVCTFDQQEARISFHSLRTGAKLLFGLSKCLWKSLFFILTLI